MRGSSTALFSMLLAASVAALPLGCSKKGDAKEDKIVDIKENDPEMEAAIAKARAALPDFWKVFEHPEHGEKDFALKVGITEKDETEHLWVANVERRDGNIYGVITNEPEFVRSVKGGQRILVPEKDISDWIYTREDGKMVGNYTLRALFKHMSPEEVKECKQKMAEP